MVNTKYILDTDAITFLYDDQRREHSRIIAKVKKLQSNSLLCISVLSLFELEYSVANAIDSTKKIKIRNTIEDIKNNPFWTILSVKPESARFYGEIKTLLKSKEGLTRSNLKKYNIDLMLASTALQEKCVLVSGDAIYKKISQYKKELQSEVWW